MLKEQKLSAQNNNINSNKFNLGEIMLDDITLEVYIADTAGLRRLGLQHIIELGKDKGMLFILPKPMTITMTNFNCEIPIDIAFFDRNYLIKEFTSFDPQGNKNPITYKTTDKMVFALEVNKGWFKKNGIKTNTQLTIMKL